MSNYKLESTQSRENWILVLYIRHLLRNKNANNSCKGLINIPGIKVGVIRISVNYKYFQISAAATLCGMVARSVHVSIPSGVWNGSKNE